MTTELKVHVFEMNSIVLLQHGLISNTLWHGLCIIIKLTMQYIFKLKGNLNVNQKNKVSVILYYYTYSYMYKIFGLKKGSSYRDKVKKEVASQLEITMYHAMNHVLQHLACNV